MFYKPVTALQDPGEPIVLPRESTDVHYEGELVVVIGKRAAQCLGRTRRATPSSASPAGTMSASATGSTDKARTCNGGAPRAATPSPRSAPRSSTGLDYSNLQLQTRLNGEVVQKQTTADLIFDCPAIVSRISGWVTLLPGDIIYTGTPGSTRKLSPGDVVEVEIENIGVLRNPVR